MFPEFPKDNIISYPSPIPPSSTLQKRIEETGKIKKIIHDGHRVIITPIDNLTSFEIENLRSTVNKLCKIYGNSH